MFICLFNQNRNERTRLVRRFRSVAVLVSLFWALGGCPPAQAQNLVKNPSFEEFNDSLNFYLYAYQDSFPGINNWFTPLTHRLGGVLVTELKE